MPDFHFHEVLEFFSLTKGYQHMLGEDSFSFGLLPQNIILAIAQIAVQSVQKMGNTFF